MKSGSYEKVTQAYNPCCEDALRNGYRPVDFSSSFGNALPTTVLRQAICSSPGNGITGSRCAALIGAAQEEAASLWRDQLGTENFTTVPTFNVLRISSLPPCACTMCFTIASPRPVPPSSRERALSTR